MNQTKEIARELEDIMDSVGMDGLMAKLVEICHAKAEHVESAWQDRNLAKMWTRYAAALDKVSARLPDPYTHS